MPTVREGQAAILVSAKNRNKLKRLGTKGETYDDVIQRLIEKTKEDENGKR